MVRASPPPLLRWLLLLTGAYIVWQISLSGAILTAQTMEQSDRLSELARRTVGFGMALFVFRAGYARLGCLRVLPVALFLGWAAMWSEEAIVNHFAEASSAQARVEAKTIQLFNTAFAQGKVTLPGLPASIAEHPARAKAFSRVLSFAIWNDPALIRQIEARTDAMLNALYGQELYDRVDAGYERYRKAFAASAEKLAAMREAVARINFARYARDLNGQLAAYAACRTDDCRNAVNARVTAYLRRSLPELDLPLELETFCRQVRRPDGYVMGRAVPGGTERVCATNEKELHAWVGTQLAAAQRAAIPRLDDLPEALRARILNGEPLRLATWRELWKARIDDEVAQRREAEFGRPERYGRGGAQEKEGRSYAVSVFLPPVALGFSVSVCFLHLGGIFAAFTRRPAVCALAAGLCWALPAFLATPTPLGGFAGIYARWLVFWEGVLYPLGILRPFLV